MPDCAIWLQAACCEFAIRESPAVPWPSCTKRRTRLEIVPIATEPRAAIVEQDAYSWKRAAKLLGITVEDTQKLIAEGQLKLLDTFVTDRSFEDFCRKHGNEINLSLMDPATKKWLMGEYGISEAADGKAVPRAQKHALIVRECRCGRKIAGNVYFRHVRHCRLPKVRSMGGIM